MYVCKCVCSSLRYTGSYKSGERGACKPFMALLFMLFAPQNSLQSFMVGWFVAHKLSQFETRLRLRAKVVT